jgi:hypothetical protein
MVLHNRMVSNQPQVYFSEALSLAELGRHSENIKENVLSLAASMMEIKPLAE